MKIQSCIAALLTTTLVALAGCGENFAAPQGASAPEGPSHIALLLPAVQSARAAARPVQTSTGAVYTFGIQEMLFADGKAVGVATLSDPDNPSRRFHYRFETGETACENNTPTVRVNARVNVYACPSDCVNAAAGRISLQSGLYHAHPGVDFPSDRSEEPELLRWTWDQEDPAGREGEHFETPVRELFFAREICGSE